ncbi:N-(5'-phosphoribosyl)anthranilate isomerase [Bacillus sp. VT-16-64]|nr:N-(5'-phosphoribosyl)anthranilate isomerase [Bacillus sp. VT-16-64]
MQVKICGITTEDAAIAASRYGADMIGFVFAESSRRISPEKAKEIVQLLSDNVKITGVFVNEKAEVIRDIKEMVSLDYVQLHGDESPEFCKSLGVPVIKALAIREKSVIEKMSQYNCDYFLLDSPGVQYRGGSGKTFDWHLLQDRDIPNEKIILAGGLNEINVHDAIRTVRPAMVDVSSGVETNGKKDVKKIAAFIKAVKGREKDVRVHIT